MLAIRAKYGQMLSQRSLSTGARLLLPQRSRDDSLHVNGEARLGLVRLCAVPGDSLG